MKGLELAKYYYETTGRVMLERIYPELMPRMAIGLAGEGSECVGFDDEFSRDHDWGPSFCIWLEEDDYKKYGKGVQAVYNGLPREIAGFTGRQSNEMSDGRVGVLCTTDWYRRYVGYPEGPVTLEQWRRVPEAFLATAVNGEVFHDPLGHFSGIRQRLIDYYPEDVRIKKIAARAATMAQAGQYNYARCIRRKDRVAAQLAKAEFTKATLSMVYLLNRKYAPFYKWMHFGAKQLPILPRVAVQLEMLSREDGTDAAERIEGICMNISAELRRQDLIEKNAAFLLELCPDLMQHIRDPYLRKTHFMQE